MNDKKLLQAILYYPPIWDITHKSYHNRLVTRNCWESVSKSVRESSEVCKKRFKALREKFYREKRKEEAKTQRSGGSDVYRSPWPHMSFFRLMRNAGKGNSTASNVSFQKNLIKTETHDSLDNALRSVQTEQDYSQLHSEEDVDEETTHDKGCVTHRSSNYDDIGSFSDNSSATSTPTLKPSPKFTFKVKEKKVTDGDPFTATMETFHVTTAEFSHKKNDKVSTFCKYLEAELQSFPKKEQEDFMEEITLNLLTYKRNINKL